MGRLRSAFLAILWALSLFSAPVESPTGGKRAATEPLPYLQSEVPEAAGKTARTLEEIRHALPPSRREREEKSALSELLRSTEAFRRKLHNTLEQTRDPKKLKTGLDELALRSRNLEESSEELEEKLETYGAALKELEENRLRWRATLREARASKAPEAIVRRAQSTLEKIRTLQEELKKRHDQTLTSLDALSKEIQALETTSARIRASLSRRGGRLLQIEAPTLFSVLRTRELRPADYFHGVAETVRKSLAELFRFYTGDRERLYTHLGLTLLFLVVMLYLYARERRGTLFLFDDRQVRAARLFVAHPLIGALLLSLFSVPLIYPERPTSVAETNLLLALGMLAWIHRERLTRSAGGFVTLLALLFLLVSWQNHMPREEATVRTVWLLMEATLLIASLRFLRTGGPFGASQDLLLRLFARLWPLVPLLSFVALAANLAGAVHLSVRLFSALVTSLILFVIFVTVAEIAGGLVTMLVRRRALEHGDPLDLYAEQTRNYLTFLVNLFLMVYWFYLVLRQFDLLYALSRRWEALTKVSWRVGEVTVSVGALIDFFVVLAVTAFLTRLVSALLDLELFSRYRFPRGVPAAIRMLVRYLIITVGVVFALTVLGVRLTDLSLIAGALGVGIGFGLRNIMANFVSGLLLVFERPVQQGDVVQVGGVTGDVQKIGVRATTIKTYDGSEVIVPNADFITKEVTNWTLSSKSRRVKMGYKVAFGNDPREVIRIIRQAIEKHPEIRKDPEPKVLFEGYGDYYLEFTVYFWVDGRLLDVKSETALNIYEALTEAGVEMPVPFSRVSYRNQEEKF